jgi:hypothetical protein
MLTRRTILTAAPAAILPAMHTGGMRTPEDRLRAAVVEIRHVADLLGISDYIVMIGREESGTAQLLDFDGSTIELA